MAPPPIAIGRGISVDVGKACEFDSITVILGEIVGSERGTDLTSGIIAASSTRTSVYMLTLG